MASSDMDSLSPVSSEELYVSTGEYQLPPEKFPYVSDQPSSQPVSLPRCYQTLGQIIFGIQSLYKNPIWTDMSNSF